MPYGPVRTPSTTRKPYGQLHSAGVACTLSVGSASIMESPVDNSRQQIELLEGEPTHSEDGVDLTLIRWMLSMTAAERLDTLQNTLRSIMTIRTLRSHRAGPEP
jgi:hypothetical protein